MKWKPYNQPFLYRCPRPRCSEILSQVSSEDWARSAAPEILGGSRDDSYFMVWFCEKGHGVFISSVIKGRTIGIEEAENEEKIAPQDVLIPHILEKAKAFLEKGVTQQPQQQTRKGRVAPPCTTSNN